ncbi:hypothetical protein CMV_018244 [Castanea mollissima]|uniref:Uncharacterized protein n=1 Tax=Castanea mollissima TaxID=60419 RepID=A0A8J4R2Q6_9ROSI|nr:hypothetical protein CMV_018244 [Castanea mollissima]
MFTSSTHSFDDLCGGVIRCVVWWRFRQARDGTAPEEEAKGTARTLSSSKSFSQPECMLPAPNLEDKTRAHLETWDRSRKFEGCLKPVKSKSDPIDVNGRPSAALSAKEAAKMQLFRLLP